MNKTPVFVMGTAQLGMPYGIINEPWPSHEERISMVKQAVRGGVHTFDTARAYGEAENILGESVSDTGNAHIVTKIAPSIKPGQNITEHIHESLERSRSALKNATIQTLLFHRVEHAFMDQSMGARILDSLLDDGLIEGWGVSVGTPQEAEAALDLLNITHIQMPYNILDHRWDRVERKIRDIKRTRKMTVHLRSLYLQGVLLSHQQSWPKSFTKHISRQTEAWLRDVEKTTPHTGNRKEFIMAWAKGIAWADGIVMGSANKKQLEENIRLFKETTAIKIEEHLFVSRPKLPENALNPALWPKP